MTPMILAWRLVIPAVLMISTLLAIQQGSPLSSDPAATSSSSSSVFFSSGLLLLLAPDLYAACRFSFLPVTGFVRPQFATSNLPRAGLSAAHPMPARSSGSKDRNRVH